MNATTSHQSTSKSSTLASLKSSLIARVNHAGIRRQRSAVDTCVSDVSADVVFEGEVGRRVDSRGSVPAAQSGVHRRRIRSPFSSSRVLSEPSKPAKSSLADQRIMESVVFRPPTTSSTGRNRHAGDGQTAEVGVSRRRSADITAGVDSSPDLLIDRQGVVVFKRSLSQGQGYDQAATTTIVRSVSSNNTLDQLPPFVNGNFNELP